MSVLTADQQSSLATLVSQQFPAEELAAARDAEAATVATRTAAMQAVVALGVGGALTGPDGEAGAMVGAQAVAQATTYLAEDATNHVADGVAHHVFNTLRADRPGADVTVVVAKDKIALLNAAPDLLDAEIAWRTQAASNETLATAKDYWDRSTAINPNDPLSQKIIGLLVAAGICTTTLAQQIVDACTETVPGPMSNPIHDAGLDAATYEDVRQVVAAALANLGG